jgi:hypothetical protein
VLRFFVLRGVVRDFHKFSPPEDKKMKKIFCTPIILLFITTLSFSIERIEKLPDNHPMHWSAFLAKVNLNRNHLWSPVWNIGNLSDNSYTSKNIRWPGEQGSSYWGGISFYVGAKVIDLTSFKGKQVPYSSIPPDTSNSEVEFLILSESYLPFGHSRLSLDRTHQQIWQSVPGFFNDGMDGWIWGVAEDVNNDGELSPGEDLNFNGLLDNHLNPPEGVIKSLAISTDKRTWPEFWPGGSYIGDDRPNFGRPPQTTTPGKRAGKWNGEFKAAPIADQETLYMMDDHENDRWNDFYREKYWPMKNPDGTPDTTSWLEGGIAGAGIEVESRTYAWSHPLAEDLLVSTYRIRNYSDYILNHVIAGISAEVNPGFSMHSNIEYDSTDFDILYLWHEFPENSKLGVLAFALLESPGISYNDIDDDGDYLIDESMNDGIDNDGDWRPFDDIGLDNLSPADMGYQGPDEDGTEGNGIWDTEDTNFNGILDNDEDKNDNGRLDAESVNDDTGVDGIAPDEYGWPGADQDGSECNGLLELGEPNFDLTDIDEADQAGMKYLYVYERNKYLLNRERFWYLYMMNDNLEIIETDEDLGLTFGAREIMLGKNEWKRFSFAMIMGENSDDMIRNKSIMQHIYSHNYRFFRPPEQPNLKCDVSEGRVHLSWDSEAEKSKDPLLGKDFNGYRIYKSTDSTFSDIKSITDAFGNVLLFEPLAIFDRVDSLTGEHPVPFPDTDIHYNMGNDTGHRYSYDDSTVVSGQHYCYAICAFDAGNYLDFKARGLVSKESSLAAVPGESPFNIVFNSEGEVVYRDRNTVYIQRLSEIISDPGATIASDFIIGDNYPNPFNSVTTIDYYTPKSSNVSIAIYNTLGQKVRMLIKGKRAAGKYSVKWDGKNDEGRLMSSGTYYYILKSKNVYLKKKLTLVK